MARGRGFGARPLDHRAEYRTNDFGARRLQQRPRAGSAFAAKNWGRAFGAACSLLLTWLTAGSAFAQYGPGMGPGMQPGMGPAPGPGPGETKEEGPAEEAPSEERPGDLEPLLGYPSQSKKRLQVFELDGYMRLRTDYMHNFSLGQSYTDGDGVRPGLPPFPWPLGCLDDPQLNKDPVDARCGSRNQGSANTRLRLEPTFNVTDLVRVMAQVDLLDNTVMGSTPDSLAGLGRSFSDRPGVAPLPSLSNGQDPPEIGQNGYQSSVRAKRAWAEVRGELGQLSFGRMPWRFGRGIAFNPGDCPDCDGGSNVDRVMAIAGLYGHQMGLAYDWAAQGTTSGMVDFGRYDASGQAFDLSQRDDVFQMVATITRIDEPATLRDRIDRGDFVVNYGLQLVYRDQHKDVEEPDTTMTPVAGSVPSARDVRLRTVNALVVQPDVWFKLMWKALTIEGEVNTVLGKMDHAYPLIADKADDALTIRQFGWVLASELHLDHDAFFLGFETGGASGDQAEDRTQYLNYRWKFVPQPAGDHLLADFKFSPEYHVDEILFRRILGTVTNAVYIKPAIAYWIGLGETRQLGLSGAFIYSFPLEPVSTPGNDMRGYGLEMDLGATYRNRAEGFYAGVTWGVLWPLWSLDRPAPLWTNAASAAAGMSVNGSDADAAQVLRTFLGVRF